MNVSWRKLKFQVDAEQARVLEEFLVDRGVLAISIENAGDDQLYALAQEQSPLWKANTLSALFDSNTDVTALAADVASALSIPLMHPPQEVADQDWVSVYRSQSKPLCFGERLWVVPEGHTAPEGAITLFLDAGLAFGSGAHATTALCLDWLSRQNLQGKSILDYGCGSGILALAALKLGATQALGVDIDQQALETSRENATRNGLVGLFEATLPEEIPVGYRADIILANILANPLIGLASHLMRFMVSDGYLLLTGILSKQVDRVRSAYTDSFDFSVDYRTQAPNEQWALLLGRKRIDC